MLNYFQRVSIGFIVWWVLLMPFDFGLLGGFFQTIRLPFYWLLTTYDEKLIFETDTSGYYLLFAFSIFLGIISAPIIQLFSKRFNFQPTAILQKILQYLLFFFLFSYGWYKLIGVQFYAPSANILFTPFGQLSKDIAFWSLVGSSPLFSISLGIIELITTLLLLVKRTQFLAAVLSLFVFGFIFLINLSFDISVKGLSGSLLLFALMYNFYFLEKWQQVFVLENINNNRLSKKTWLKMIIVGLLVMEVVIPKNVEQENEQTVHYTDKAFQINNHKVFKRVFIHSDNYIILQDKSDRFFDFKIEAGNRSTCVFKVGTLSLKDKQVYLSDGSYKITEIPTKHLPLNNKTITWFADDFH
jgi:hypothetical protein